MSGEGVDNVALRDDSIDPFAVFAGDKSANISGDQRLYGCTYGVVWPDGRYCTSLVVQDCFDVHREASQAFARAAPLANAYRIGAAAVLPQYMAICPTFGDDFLLGQATAFSGKGTTVMRRSRCPGPGASGSR